MNDLGLSVFCVGALSLLQVNFPRSPRVRKRWLFRRVCELAAFSGLLLFIANQYLEPAVSNAMKPLSQSDWWRVLERVLKLALPNLYAWLVSGGGEGRGRGEGGRGEGEESAGARTQACTAQLVRMAGELERERERGGGGEWGEGGGGWRVLERVLKLALPNLYAWLVSERGRGAGEGGGGWRVLERVLKLALPNLYAWLVSGEKEGRGRGGGGRGGGSAGARAQACTAQLVRMAGAREGRVKVACACAVGMLCVGRVGQC